jgi:hypothetical protein
MQGRENPHVSQMTRDMGHPGWFVLQWPVISGWWAEKSCALSLRYIYRLRFR